MADLVEPGGFAEGEDGGVGGLGQGAGPGGPGGGFPEVHGLAGAVATEAEAVEFGPLVGHADQGHGGLVFGGGEGRGVVVGDGVEHDGGEAGFLAKDAAGFAVIEAEAGDFERGQGGLGLPRG